MTSKKTNSSFWRIGTRVFDLNEEPLIVGVLNVTPDSFYDGTRHEAPEEAIRCGLTLASAGASIVDCGGESARPGATEVSASEQVRRLKPVVAALVAEGIIVSVDTRSADVASALLDEGAMIVNDVSGGGDVRMGGVVAAREAAWILMHSKGTPKTMQVNPHYDDVMGEIRGALAQLLESAVQAGVSADRVVLDPGIGFGKRPDDNLDILARLDSFQELGRPLMVGVSRKSFLASVGAGDTSADRLAGSLAAGVIAYQHGARVFRTHDPLETVRALSVARNLAAHRGAAASVASRSAA